MSISQSLTRLLITLSLNWALSACSQSGDDIISSTEPVPTDEPSPETIPEIPLIESNIKLESDVQVLAGNSSYTQNCADSASLVDLDVIDFAPQFDGSLEDWNVPHFSNWIWSRNKDENKAIHPDDRISVFKVARVNSVNRSVQSTLGSALVVGLELDSQLANVGEILLEFKKMVSNIDGTWVFESGPQLRIDNQKAFIRAENSDQWRLLTSEEFVWSAKDFVGSVQIELAIPDRLFGEVILSPVWSTSASIVISGERSLPTTAYFRSSEVFSSKYFRWKHCLSYSEGRSIHSVLITDSRVPLDLENRVSLQTSQVAEWMLTDSKFLVIPNNITFFLLSPEVLGEELKSNDFKFVSSSTVSKSLKGDLDDLGLVNVVIEHLVNIYSTYSIGKPGLDAMSKDESLFNSLYKQNLRRRHLSYGDYIAHMHSDFISNETKFSYLLDSKFPRVIHVLGDFLQSELGLSFLSYLERALPDKLFERISKGWLDTSSEFDAEFLPTSFDDLDGDGLVYFEEKFRGTDPNNRDTDLDGYSDFAEIALGTSPKQYSSKLNALTIDGIVEDWFLYAPNAIKLEENPKTLSESCPDNAKIVAHFFVFQNERLFLGAKSGFQSTSDQIVFKSEINLKNQNEYIQMSGKVGDSWLDVRRGDLSRKIPLNFKVHPFENEWYIPMNSVGLAQKTFDAANVRFSVVMVDGAQEILCYTTGWYNPTQLVR